MAGARTWTAALACALLPGSAASPATQKVSPQERDTYAVYSAVLDNIPAGGQPGRWLVQPLTTGLPATSPCLPPSQPSPEASLEGNAHLDIRPPEDQVKRFHELLEDFDAHCHDTARLRASMFKTRRPVRVLTETEAAHFSGDIDDADPKKLVKNWPGASGLLSFSRVFFNSDRTVAMVHRSVYCGALCGTWEWQILERSPTGWRVLRWKR